MVQSIKFTKHDGSIFQVHHSNHHRVIKWKLRTL